MALKDPAYKIQSSLAAIEFCFRDLPEIQNKFDWQTLLLNPSTTISSHKQYNQNFEALRISMIAYHVEIMKQSLFEYHELKKKYLSAIITNHLQILIDFLSILRNGLLHTKNNLVPIWQNNDKERAKRIINTLLMQGLRVTIPANICEKGTEFNEKSKKRFEIFFPRIVLGNEIALDAQFISMLRLLSWHILTVTKKRNIRTLTQYLHNCNTGTVL